MILRSATRVPSRCSSARPVSFFFIRPSLVISSVSLSLSFSLYILRLGVSLRVPYFWFKYNYVFLFFILISSVSSTIGFLPCFVLFFSLLFSHFIMFLSVLYHSNYLSLPACPLQSFRNFVSLRVSFLFSLFLALLSFIITYIFLFYIIAINYLCAFALPSSLFPK